MSWMISHVCHSFEFKLILLIYNFEILATGWKICDRFGFVIEIIDTKSTNYIKWEIEERFGCFLMWKNKSKCLNWKSQKVKNQTSSVLSSIELKKFQTNMAMFYLLLRSKWLLLTTWSIRVNKRIRETTELFYSCWNYTRSSPISKCWKRENAKCDSDNNFMTTRAPKKF